MLIPKNVMATGVDGVQAWAKARGDAAYMLYFKYSGTQATPAGTRMHNLAGRLRDLGEACARVSQTRRGGYAL